MAIGGRHLCSLVILGLTKSGINSTKDIPSLLSLCHALLEWDFPNTHSTLYSSCKNAMARLEMFEGLYSRRTDRSKRPSTALCLPSESPGVLVVFQRRPASRALERICLCSVCLLLLALWGRSLSPPQGLVVVRRPVASPASLSPQAQRHISDLYEDLRDGHNLISLLEVLSGDSLVRTPAHHPLRGPACLPPGHPHLPSLLGAFPTCPLHLAWPRPLLHLLVRSIGLALALAPMPRAHSPAASCAGVLTVTSRSALLWFLCCLDSEP